MEKDILVNEKRNMWELISQYRNCIMGFSALAILVFHEYVPFGRLYELQKHIKTFGFVGVDIFFLLSGMGLTYAIKKSKISVFYYRRFRRLIVPVLFVGVANAIVKDWKLSEFICNIIGINFWTSNIYSFLWFIPAIMIFYLLFPLYQKILEKLNDTVAGTVIVVSIWFIISLYLERFFQARNRIDLYGFINRIPIFVIGIMFGNMAQNQKLYINKMKWIMILTINLLGLYFAELTNFQGIRLIVPVSNCFLPNVFMGISLVFILAKFFEQISCFKIGRWIVRCFQILGKISLELYCVQEFVAELLLQNIEFTNNLLRNIFVFFVVLLATLIVYYTEIYFWKLVDKFVQ